ncbi:hypothetical protein KPH14_012756 [Odynerus spinipes]|uniref:RNA-directed DNA polymerase n=1 Tax=Odynerus spinipes TaxID=1348599 RepID=A0AAD9RA16_9HYME|nr:hypothetical protein KPH14_012756 [Odynerus spinipes]
MEAEYQKLLKETQLRMAQMQKEWERQHAESERIKAMYKELETQMQAVHSRRPEATQNVSVFSTIGSLAEFKIGEDWNLYQKHLNQYFVANSVPQERKVAVLITMMGPEAYKILKDLCGPLPPSDRRYEELCAILDKQFSPSISVHRERRKFYGLKQGNGETISQWFARIKSEASNCKFGAQLENIIRDKFIAGLKEGKILDRICEEDHTKSLPEIVEVAKKREASILQSNLTKEVEVYKVNLREANKKEPSESKAFKRKSQQQGEENFAPKCKHCGGTQHSFARCKYKDYKCKRCNKVGHLIRVCKENGKQHVKQNYLSDSNVAATVEIDSGASRSVISESFWQDHLSNYELKKTEAILRFYDGRIIRPVGQVVVDIVHGHRKIEAALIVVKKGSRPLFGRDLMKRLGFKVIQVNKVEFNSELQRLLEQYEVLFDNKLGRYKYNKVELRLVEGARPIFLKPRPIPLAFKEEVSRQLEELEKSGIIERAEDNAWGTPLVPVLKSNGELRICADYKMTLNKVIEDVKYPLPRIEELFAALSGGKKFSKLDLSAVYSQLEVSEDTKKLLAWSTHKGVYLLNRLPLGTKPACAIFQRVIEKVLQGAKGVINFLDDIVVTGASDEKHLQNFKEVLGRLKEAGFKLNMKKCAFFQDEIRYLGHIINKDGLHKDPEKVAAIRNAKRPADVTELKAFIGMVNYYAKFVPHFSNHKPLLALFGEQKGIPQMAAGRLQRWTLFLSGLAYKLQYVKGKDNGAADGLSRLPIEVQEGTDESKDYFNFIIEDKIPLQANQIRRELRRDPVLSKVYKFTLEGWPVTVQDEFKPYERRAKEISVENGLLLWGYRVIIPEMFREYLLKDVHEGHMGVVKMKSMARQYFWWPGLDKDIEEFGKRCLTCRSSANLPEKAALVKFKEAERPFERVHIDFLGPFKGKVYLIIVDAYSKWPEIVEMAGGADTNNTIEKLRECFARFGLPKVLFSDNGRQFISQEFQIFCEKNGIKHKTSAPYHPATNGLAERAVGSFKRGLEKALKDDRNKSVTLTTMINRYLFAYRNAPHESTGETPAQRMFGRRLRTRFDLLNKPKVEEAADRQTEHFRGGREVEFSKGETVLVRDYRDPGKPKWELAVIRGKPGSRTYICQPLFDPELEWKRHTDQIIEAGNIRKEDAPNVTAKADKNEPMASSRSDAVSLNINQRPKQDRQRVV